MKGLRLAPGLDLPVDFATEGVVVMGVRGSGKTNTEVRFVELLHAAGIPFVAIDPKGDWYGVRMDGTGPGLPVPVFGGLYGDFPIDGHLGARIADLLVDENLSAVLDVSKMAKTGARATFLTDFFKRLMERHQDEPHVRTVVLEEAHSYIPQQVKGGSAAALKEASASVLLEGRSFGLGCWACTQRPARLHNDVLEEVDTAIIHRIGVTATADLKRVREWVKHEDLSDEISASLTKLADGEAWVLSPVALGVVQRVQVDRRTTFESNATPGVGVSKRRLATMADIDAGAIKQALDDVIEKAKADDPRTLRQRIAELERALAQRPKEQIEVPVVPEGLLDRLQDLEGTIRDDLREHLSDLDRWLQTAREMRNKLLHLQNLIVQQAAGTPQRSMPRSMPAPKSVPPQVSTPTRTDTSLVNGKLGKGELTVLGVLAEFPEGRTQNEVAFLAGYSANASTIGVILANLRKQGLVEPGQPVRPTPAGLAAVGGPVQRPSGQALLEHWLNHKRMGGGERKVLLALVDAWPGSLSHVELCERTGYSPDASTVGVILSKLGKLGLVTVERGERRLVEEFADAIRT